MATRLGRLVRAPLAALLIATAAFSAPSGAAAAPVGPDLVVDRYAQALGTINGELTTGTRHALAERLLLLARYYELDPRLLAALVSVESSWHARAVSPVGALGFGQLMPSTAASLDVVALEPYENLDGTARYLRRLLNRFPTADRLTRVRLALASYNAGPAAVTRYNGVPPYRETQAYVVNVVRRWQRLVATLDLPRAALLDVSRAAPIDVPGAAPIDDQSRPQRDVAPLRAPRKLREPRESREPRVVAANVAVTVAKRTLRAKAAPRPHKPVRVAAAWQPYHSPYLDAMHPDSMPLASPEPVRFEPSHSLFARILGLRHRVGGPAPANAATAAAPAPDAPTPAPSSAVFR